jgi:sec-independent protein translocase protein TatA
MRGILEPEHLLLILLVVLVLFGGKKIPELAGGLGKGIREFKRGMHELTDADAPSVSAPGVSAPAESRPVTAAVAEAAAERAPKRLLG